MRVTRRRNEDEPNCFSFLHLIPFPENDVVTQRSGLSQPCVISGLTFGSGVEYRYHMDYGVGGD